MNKEETLYEDLFEIEATRRRQYQKENHELKERLDYEIHMHIMSNKNYCEIIAKLKQRINEALEYIDRRDIEWGSDEHIMLIKILKGENNK